MAKKASRSKGANKTERILDGYDRKLTQLLCDTTRELIDRYAANPEEWPDVTSGLKNIVDVMQARPGG